MPDYTWNKLIISSNDEQLKGKIKKVLFKYDAENNPILTMRKLLPRPEGFDENPGYNDFGYDWSIAIWGTKWDVDSHEVIESGETITIYYDTAWDPNIGWFKKLCEYIEIQMYLSRQKSNDIIQLTIEFVNEYEDFGTRIEWSPGKDYLVTKNIRIPYEW
jgi:hypothetical protein